MLSLSLSRRPSCATIILVLFVGLRSFAALAQGDTKPFVVPPMVGPVTDEAGVLSPRAVQKLSSVLIQLHDSGGSQIAVLTVPSLGDASIEEAGIKVTDQWKLGGKGKDNGVLLLIAPNDRKVRIEVGKGLEGELTDAYSRRIINQVITPAFKENDFDSGIVGGVVQIIAVTDPNFDLQSTGMQRRGRSSGKSMSPMQGLGLLVLLIIFIIIAVIHRILQFFGLVPRSGFGRSGSWIGGGLGGLGGGGFGGGGGGSSWGGGGGGFSGGGSSGQW